MKAFFEEYGMVLVVTIVAVGMILFSNEFQSTMTEQLSSRWDAMIAAGTQ